MDIIDNLQKISDQIQPGVVVIDKYGDSFVFAHECFFPVNPNEPFSIIRWHKFDYTGARIANDEETKEFFKKLESNGFKFDENTLSVEREKFETTSLGEFIKLLKDTACRLSTADIPVTINGKPIKVFGANLKNEKGYIADIILDFEDNK